MKTPALVGIFTGLGFALLILVVFFLGFHADAEKVKTIQPIQGIVSIAIMIAGVAWAMRLRRAEVPPENGFSYGQAFGAGVVCGACAALVGALFYVLYLTVINPGFTDVMMEMQAAGLQAKNLPPDKLEAAEKFMRMMFHPAVQFIFSVIFNTLLAVVIAAVAAIFFKRAPRIEAPALPTAAAT